MKEKKTTHGGARPGSGPKPVEEKRKQYPVTVLPSIMTAFRSKYGRGVSRKIEEMIKNDLSKISE